MKEDNRKEIYPDKIWIHPEHHEEFLKWIEYFKEKNGIDVELRYISKKEWGAMIGVMISVTEGVSE